jgi:hypothetical protein
VLDPPEELLVVRVHTESDLRLATVAAEVSFSDKDAEEKTHLELLLFHRHVSRETVRRQGSPRVVVSPSSFP